MAHNFQYTLYINSYLSTYIYTRIKEVAMCDYEVETGPLPTTPCTLRSGLDSEIIFRGRNWESWNGADWCRAIESRTGPRAYFNLRRLQRRRGLKPRRRRKRGSIWSRRKWKEEEQRGEREREREIHRLSSIVESDAIRNEIGFSVGHSVLLSKYPNRFSRKGVGIRSVAAFSIPSVPFLFVPCTLARKLQAPRLSCSCTSRTCTWMETAMPTPPVLLLIRSSPF